MSTFEAVTTIEVYLFLNLTEPILKQVVSNSNITVDLRPGIVSPAVWFNSRGAVVAVPATWDILSVGQSDTRTLRVVVSDANA